VKTIEEDAAATEYRYRALCCVVRPPREEPRSRPCSSGAGHQVDSREGPIEKQGADMLLLRPGDAAVEYDISRIARRSDGREWRVVVEQFAFGTESRLELGGRVLVDDVEIGTFETFHARGRDEVRVQEFIVTLPSNARRLRLESSPAGSPAPRTIRVRRVAVIEIAPDSDSEPDSQPDPGASG